jgi:hypothetical protein
MTMRKQSRAASAGSDELRPEYRFDYSKARPNPYAERLRGKTVAVVLHAEVAAAFPTSESVNTALRSVMGLVRRRSSRRQQAAGNRGSNKKMQRTRSAEARRRSPRR